MTQTDTFTVPDAEEVAPFTPRQLMLRRALAHKGFLLGAALIATLGLIAIFAPLIAPHDPFVQSLSTRMLPPIWSEGGMWDHLLGTDQNGRDYLSRLIYGARVSISIGLGAATIGLLIGVSLGVFAGYFGGWVDHAVSFLLTAQLALPGLLLAMAPSSLLAHQYGWSSASSACCTGPITLSSPGRRPSAFATSILLLPPPPPVPHRVRSSGTKSCPT